MRLGTRTYTISPTELVIRGVSRSCGEVQLFQITRATGAFEASGRSFNYNAETGQCLESGASSDDIAVREIAAKKPAMSLRAHECAIIEDAINQIPS
jgi:hypothetical protein